MRNGRPVSSSALGVSATDVAPQSHSSTGSMPCTRRKSRSPVELDVTTAAACRTARRTRGEKRNCITLNAERKASGNAALIPLWQRKRQGRFCVPPTGPQMMGIPSLEG